MMTSLLAGLVGAGGGFAYWKLIGCRNGSCAIGANKYMSMFMGALLGLTLAGDLAHAQQPKLRNVDNATFAAEMKAKNVVIIDMRTPSEVKSGFIPGAINLDVYDPEFKAKLQKLDKSKKYMVYCRSGARSSNGGNMMLQMGFKEVVNLSRGMMGWNGAVQKP
jgi:rhodanese-related sulfurtransferase